MKALFELLIVTVLVGAIPNRVDAPMEAAEDAVSFGLPVAAAARAPALARTSIYRLPVSRDRGPRLLDPQSIGVAVTAASAIVADRESGVVLFEKDADIVRPIASITKLMTALVLLEVAPELDGLVTIAAEDQVAGDGSIFRVGDRIPERDLFFAMLVGSANDAARALVRSSGLTREEFVARMNAKARELGMGETRFAEPTGLDPQNVSTAREIVRLLQAAYGNPLIAEATQTALYRTPGSTKKAQAIPSTDRLLSTFINSDPFRIAVAKTGSLDEAGFCMTAAVDEAEHGVIVVALASENHFSRFEDITALAYWGLTKWEWPETDGF